MQTFYLGLGLRGADVESKDVQTDGLKVLQFWKQSQGDCATQISIIQALGNCGKAKEKQEIQNRWEMKGKEKSFV